MAEHISNSDFNPAYTRMRALVVDDQTFARKMVCELLRQLGFNNIDEAKDGSEALEFCAQHHYDLIICDIEMEAMDGLTFLDSLRNKQKNQINKTPVIFLTVHAESDIVAQAKQKGTNGFLVKPPSLKALKDRVKYALKS